MRRLLPIAFLALFACHDAQRENPFDPVLTPAPQLQVALDDTAGTATLTWTPYEGEAPFAAYWVLRNAVESSRVDTLSIIGDAATTAFSDTDLAPDTAYEYRLSAVNTAGLEVPSEKQSISGYTIDAVTLREPEPDSEEGTIVLRWSQYRDPGFSSYSVTRRQVGTDLEQEIATLTARGDTSFADDTALHAVDYLYTVTVQAAGEALTSSSQETRLLLPTVQLMEPVFDSATASAALEWAPYRGPSFETYRITRRTETESARIVGEIVDVDSTALTYSGLRGNTEYFYQVTVITERGEEIPSGEMTGAFHRLVASWPLIGASRLYEQPDGRIAVLNFDDETREKIRLLSFGADGAIVDEQVLQRTLTSRGLPPRTSHSFGTAVNEEGHRVLVHIGRPGFAAGFTISEFLPAGEAVEREFTLEVEAAEVSGDYDRVTGEIRLEGGGWFDNVVVSSGGSILFEEDFSEFPLTVSGVGGTSLADSVEGWVFEGPAPGIRYPWWTLSMLSAEGPGLARRSDPSWVDFDLDADVLLFTDGPASSIQLGGDSYSRYALSLDSAANEIELLWEFSPPEGSDQEPGTARSTLSVPLYQFGPAMRATLERTSSGARARIVTPVTWLDEEESAVWSSAVSLAGKFLLTVDERAYLLTPGSDKVLVGEFGERVSTLRTWQDNRGRTIVGVCLPEANQVQLGRMPDTIIDQWSTALSGTIGPAVTEGDFLFWPISVDGGPDGRIYVLDASNARIVVFDSARRFITQWGSFGDGPDQFNFGRGAGVPKATFSTSPAVLSWMVRGSSTSSTSGTTAFRCSRRSVQHRRGRRGLHLRDRCGQPADTKVCALTPHKCPISVFPSSVNA